MIKKKKPTVTLITEYLGYEASYLLKEKLTVLKVRIRIV